MIPTSRRRAAAPKAQPQFSSWNDRASQSGPPGSFPANELSHVTINFIAPPVRCKVYQPMELRCNGIKVTPGPITAKLQSFNPKTPKTHKLSAKLEDSSILVKLNSMGSIHLRFPVAGQWSLSVEYEGEVYTKHIEVHGQRGKNTKLQSKLVADALFGGQDDLMESEDSTEDAASDVSSATTTPRQMPGGNYRSPARHPTGLPGHHPGLMPNELTERHGVDMMGYGVHHEAYGDVGSVASGMVSYRDASEKMRRSGLPLSPGVANPQNSAGSNLMQHPSVSTPGATSLHPYQHSNTAQYPSHMQTQLQPPYPLQPLSSMPLQHGSKFDYGNESVYTPNPHSYYSSPIPTPNQGSTTLLDPYSQMPESPNVSDGMMPEGSTFAYNDMGQYGSAFHMKQQEADMNADMNYIQPDAMYYPIPPALSDDLIQYTDDCPSSPSIDSSDGSSGTSTPVVRSGYPFLSRMVPSSTSDVVSLGQECCLVGQNFVYSDSDANSIWFTLQANKAKVKAPIQRSTSTTHIATIPPLSYFGISYALEPLMAIVELYQYSLLVPCEQQFYYLTTQGQQGSTNKLSVQEHNGGSLFSRSADSMMKPDPGVDTTHTADPHGGYFAGGASFFFNTGVPSLNTLTVDNNLEAIQTLVKNGADVNQPDLWGITPLHLAIFFGRKAIANFLLRNSVEKSVQTEDINGDTPLDLVIRHWDPEVRGLYDVMVSLLHDPSQTVSEADRATGETLSRRAASAGASSSLPKKPSFRSKKPMVVPKEKSLSSTVPFKLEGDTLRVLRPEFWTELMVAIEKMAGVSSMAAKSSQSPLVVSSSLPSTLSVHSEAAQSSDSLEEEKKLLELWSQISKAKVIDSSSLNLETFPNIPVHAFPVVESLDFSGNALKFLPHDWSKFSKLSKLNVSRNLIDILPPSLVSLPSLSTFSYEENPLRLLPTSVTAPVDKSSTWVRANSGTVITNLALPAALRVNTQRKGSPQPHSKEQTQTIASTSSTPDWTRTPLYRYLHENSLNPEQLMTDSKVRVNVLGERYVERRLLQKSLQVDFSSFIARIRYKAPVISASDDVAVEDVNIKSNGDLSFETWTAGARHSDFASQVLISPLGIQVVVFSLVQPEAQEAERVQYWLEAIAARAPASPVILVACDAESVPREALSILGVVSALASSILAPNAFNAAEDVLTVSFANGDGMDALKRRFADIASRHGFANKTFPKSLAQLMQTILALKESRWFLRRSELIDLASQFGIDISTDKNFESVVQQLSALGGLVYFSDASSERLRDIVFTDPQRLCHALTNFMMRHKRLIKDGILHLSDCHPQFVSILNGLPESNTSSNNSPPLSPAISGIERHGAGTPPLPTLLSDLALSNSSPRSVSPSAHSESGPEQSNASAESNLQSSSRNSKGFLTSPIKVSSRPGSASFNKTPSANTTSPLIGRARIDDRVLVDLLTFFEEAIKLPQESVLLTRLLPETMSEDMLQQYWSQGLAHAYERIYQFSGASIPRVFFNRLRAYLYEDARVEVCLHWSRGMVLRCGSERARLSTPSPNTLQLHIAGDMPSRLLPMMVEMIEALIETFASQKLAQVLIPCPSLSSATTTLPLEDVMDALRDGQTHITRGRVNIRLSVVAPDLGLQEMQALEVEEAALVTASSDKMISDAFDSMTEESGKTAAIPDLIYASGDSKTVWLGKLRGAEEVHVAYYHRNVSPALFKTKQDYLQATSAVGLSTMKQCRDEARLLTVLQHPNIVKARAFNLSAKLLATETSQFGTLRSYLKSHSPSTSFLPEVKLRMMLELAHAVDWLHSNRVAHGAIGLDAALVTSVDVNPQHEHIKLGNFHNAKRLFTKSTQEESSDIKDIGTLFAQIWTENVDALEALAIINSRIAAHSDSSNPAVETTASSSLVIAAPAAGSQLELEVSELILNCLASTGGQDHHVTINEIIQHLEYLFAINGWLLSGSMLKVPALQSPSDHSYWKLDNSVRILEYNKREIASISSIVRASDGQVWVATASGYIHIWNPSTNTNSADTPSATRAIIQTYSIDTRQSRRRINALMTSGSYIWCITDGSICVYANDGQLVKSIMHKQSLCITKYQSPASNAGVSAPSLASSSAGSSSMVYIGGAHGEISVWDSTTFQCTLGVVLENRLPITAIAVDSRYLWIGVGVSRRICHVVALNKKTLNEICRFQAHDDLISSIVVVDNNHIWTSSFDGKINVWNIAAESDNKVVVRLEKSIMTHRRAILKMTSSPRTSDGSVSKVYASDNKCISVWDTKHNQLIDKHLIGRHRGAIGALDPIDANAFLSASVEDGCVCLWKKGHTSNK